MFSNILHRGRSSMPTTTLSSHALPKSRFRLTCFYATGFVCSKNYYKHDDFDFDIENFPFLDGDVPRRASYGV